MATQGLFRTWSGANSDLLDAGRARSEEHLRGGARRRVRRRSPAALPPSDSRFGARYGTLPFPVLAGPQPKEFAASLGTGIRFAQQRGGVDLALEYFQPLRRGLLRERAGGDGRGVGPPVGGGPPVRPCYYLSCPMPKRIYIETYGCQMNVADSELMFGVLGREGYVRAESRPRPT